MEDIKSFWKNNNDRESMNNIKRLSQIPYIPFVGSGMSVPFGFPVWKSFLSEVINRFYTGEDKIEYERRLNGSKFLELADDINKKITNGAIEEEVRKRFAEITKVDDEQNYVYLFRDANVRMFVTTNFDPVIETFMEIPADKIFLPSNLKKPGNVLETIRHGEKCVIKLHGTYNDPNSIILTKTSFKNAYNYSDKALISVIQELWNSHTLLFLGCGLKKDYLINHLIKLANSEVEHWHYAIVEYPEEGNVNNRIRELTQLKIRPIWYENGKHEQVLEILKMITDVYDPSDTKPTSMFKQNIIDANDIVRDEFAFMQSNKHIIIYGEGGLGKTTYLNDLFRNAKRSDCFSKVLYASLPAIEKFGQNNKPFTFDDAARFDVPENTYIFNYLISQEKLNRSEYQVVIRNCKSIDSKPVLLLLDDLNQMRDAMNSISDAIINEIECLSRNREYSNLIIVITNRSSKNCFSSSFYKTVTITGTPDNDCDRIIQKFGDNECIRSLVRIPMYYKMLETIPENTAINTKYDVLDKAYRELSMKPAIFSSGSARVVLYYVIAPKIARFIAEGRCVTKSRESIISEIERVIKMFQEDLTYFHLVLSEFNSEEEISMDNELKSMQADEVYEHLRNCNLIEVSNDMVGFIHQDWKDYLAARSLLADCHILFNKAKYNHTDVLKNISFNLNIPDSVNDLFLEGLGVTGDIKSKNEKLRMILNEGVYDDNGIAPSFFSVQFMDALCQISETLGSTCTEESTKYVLHNKLFKAFYRCIEKKDTQYIRELSAAGCKDYMTNILAKESEYFRRNTMYQDALRYIQFGKDLNDKDCALKLINQEGKIYLHYFQSVKSEINVLQPPQITPEKSFEKGFEIIKKCAGKCYNMSSNLYGMMISTPAPYLKEFVKIDYVEAFWTYYNVLNSKEQAFYGKQLAYSIRQAVSLIIKGYVIIDYDGVMNLNNLKYDVRDLIRGAGQTRLSKRISTGGWSLAESMLALISGDTLYFTNYLRGCVELNKGNNDYAKSYFFNDDSLLSKIRLKFEFGEIVDLKSELKNVYDNWHSEKQRYGEMDKFHPYYVYEDAKYLILEYEPNSKLFEEIEKGC